MDDVRLWPEFSSNPDGNIKNIRAPFPVIPRKHECGSSKCFNSLFMVSLKIANINRYGSQNASKSGIGFVLCVIEASAGIQVGGELRMFPSQSLCRRANAV